MISFPNRRQRKAELLDDVASAIDAGLDARAILAGPATETLRGPAADPTDGLVAGLVRRGLELTATERAVLDAAEQAGRLSEALRERAATQREYAELEATVWAGLRYPLFLVVLASAVGLFAVARSGMWLTIALLGVAAAVVLTVRFVSHLRNDPTARPRLRLLREVVDDLGEIPYLTAMHGLYAAGVKLEEAHGTSLAASPIGAVKARLFRAGEQLASGHDLTRALTATGAVSEETLHLIRTGEQTGELESAFDRAARRRGDVLSRRLGRAARLVGIVAYAIAVLVVVLVLVSFYTQYFARLASF